MKAALPIEVDPEVMSGAPVFAGTRVPVASLFDYFMKGSNLEEFLESFPTVKREDVLTILEHFKHEVSAAADLHQSWVSEALQSGPAKPASTADWENALKRGLKARRSK